MGNKTPRTYKFFGATLRKLESLAERKGATQTAILESLVLSADADKIQIYTLQPQVETPAPKGKKATVKA